MMENELPEGWVETEFKNVADVTDFVANGSFEALRQNVTQVDTLDYAILVRLKDYSKSWKGPFSYVTKESFDFLQKSSLAAGDLVISNVGAPGRLFLVPDLGLPMTLGPNGVRVRANKFTTNKFLAYYFDSGIGKNEINNIVTGTAQLKFNKTGLRASHILLPPLAEQIRIVAKLDAVFGNLETLKTSLARIPKLLKKFRQTVLTQAVTGKLTKEYRGEEELTDEWNLKSLGDLISSIEAGKNFSCPSEPVTHDSVGLVKISAVTWGVFDPQETKTVVDKKQIDSKLFIRKGDFLFSRANTLELVGASVIVEEIDYKIMLSDKIWRVIFKTEITKRYINFFLKSKIGRGELESRASGNQLSMRNISQAKFKNIPVTLPPLEEQQEIVKRVEALFAQADALEAQYQSLKAKIDKLPQALLSKAFRGELVPQDPSDEPASLLLEKLKAATAAVGKKNRKAGQTALAFMEE